MSKASATILGRRFVASLQSPSFSTSIPALRCCAANTQSIWSTSPAPSDLATQRRNLHSSRSSKRSTHPHQYDGSYTLKSCTSGGLLLVGFSTNLNSSTTQSASSAESAGTAGSSVTASSKLRCLAQQAWRRDLHTSSRNTTTATITARRYKSTQSSSKDLDKNAATTPSQPQQHQHAPGAGPNATTPPPGQSDVHFDKHDPETLAQTMSKYLHMPRMPHRPTKEELLSAANGFWERLKVRFKWASIRSMRPWNIDEWGAFVSWFLFGQLVWVLVGTTTFFSLVILSINTVFAQETLARWVGDSLTESAGVTVVFESAIVPKWGDGVISFRNVFVSRRPGQTQSSVSKGSSSSAAAAAAGRQHEHEIDVQAAAVEEDHDDGNYTQFDVTIANVNVTLSFVKWWNGKGLLKDVEVKGVRGVVDRTSVYWSNEDQHVDPLSYRHEHHHGDFEIDSFKLEDLLVTVHQPNNFRPFSVSIFSAELPQLRKQWLFYDFLSATHMSGSFDGSLFTIHPRQVHSVIAGDNRDLVQSIGEPEAWKKFSRLRIDGLRIDHLNRGVEGPFGWIYEGNVDIISDVMFPADTDESITKVMSDFYDQLEEIVVSNRLRLLQKDIADDPLTPETPESGHISQSSWSSDYEARHQQQQQQHQITPQIETAAPGSTSAAGTRAMLTHGPDDDRRYLIMDLRIHLNDVKAAVPLFTNHMSYVNQALVRPIVAYINAKRTYIPITCRIVKRADDFNGSWTVFDSGLMDDLSAESYDAFARDVEDQQSRVRRLKKVGFWTLSLAVHALFMGMAGNVV